MELIKPHIKVMGLIFDHKMALDIHTDKIQKEANNWNTINQACTLTPHQG